MRLFSKPYNSRNSTSQFEDVLKELALYKQTNYCYEYLKKKFPSMEESVIEKQAEISSSSFRQAFEFYDSAKSTYITTSPLLYSYSLNNFAKGLAYLISDDNSITNYFKRHGFKVEDKNISNNVLDSLVTIEQSGPPTAILKILGNHVIEKQTISFRKLLQHIPEIADIYLKTTNQCSLTAKIDINVGRYCIESRDWDNDTGVLNEKMEYLSCIGSRISGMNKYYFTLSVKSHEYIRENNINDDIFYKDNIILPLNLQEGMFSINVMFYTYLLIMSYGMLVRYNANMWEKFIDPKTSNEAVLISESLSESVKIFISHVHMLLFGYTYEDTKYTDKDVERVIKNSTEDIMENIKKRIISESRRTGNKAILPW